MPLRLPIFLRRPSSVSLPDSRFGAAGITISTLPFFAGSRSGSPVGKFSRFARYILGQRKASSAQPTIPRYRGIASPASWQRDESPLPAVHTGLFEPSFFNSNFSSQNTQPYTYYHLFFVFRIDADTTIQSFDEMTFPPHAYLGVGIPLLPLHDLSIDINATDFNPNDPSAWMSAEYNNSQTSSTH
ncbi:hypothetical protein EV424DRAFT_12043 [Suillus variegatus]|nr:hypothetical protein EV424DRAFT_12043 [Suillus variegatus]